MANKEKTLEQLQEELIQAQKAYDAAKKFDEQKKKEEAERKKAELALEHDKRKKEVDDAMNHAANLLKAYNEDYGTYVVTRKNISSYLLDLLFQ
jgi:uncharacterized protein YigA (DUF484 family)